MPVTYFSLGYAEDYYQPTDEPQYIEYDHAARARAVRGARHRVGDCDEEVTGPLASGNDPAYPVCSLKQNYVNCMCRTVND